jgi:hypothetical protein
MSMPERTLGRLCRRCPIAVTTPKFPPPPRSPEQLLFIVVFGDNDASIRENDLRSEQVVERESEAADQSSVTAAQGEACHANTAKRARYRREAERIGHRDDVRAAGASRNSRGTVVGADDHAVHPAQVDDNPVA